MISSHTCFFLVTSKLSYNIIRLIINQLLYTSSWISIMSVTIVEPGTVKYVESSQVILPQNNIMADDHIFTLNEKPFSKLDVKSPVELQFNRLKYVVSGGFMKAKKTVLNNVSGIFPAGQLVAIMGPSGAGKSTLLDLLSGYRHNTSGISGQILVNGKLRKLEKFRRISCYIQQDDRLQPLLTVQENMSIAADLKLGTKVKNKDKKQLIEEILSVLGLRECVNTSGSRLSGGQKKRLSIALELINNPRVMFLDEPTTGLDSSSCKQCISLMNTLADQGRTIICTIHQPSATLFQMFHQVYVLSEGRCLYQGATSNIIEYLETMNIPCPKYHNPADYVIEIASGEYGKENVELLVDGIDNGVQVKWFKDAPGQYETEEDDKVDQFTNSAFYQFFVLLRRGYIKSTRDNTLTYMRITVNLLVSLMLGLLYVNSGEDGSKVFDNYNLLFSLIMHHVMSTMMLNILTFPMEMNILLKEHFNRWYSLKAYYAACNIVDIPVTAFSCIMFSLIVYSMTNQLKEWFRFGIFLSVSLLIAFISQSIGYIFGTVLDVVNGTFAGPIFLVPLMMFSGFGVNLRDIPSYLEWGTHVSFFRYALEAYVESIYGLLRKPFTCYVDYCHYAYPKKFLEEVAMEHIDLKFCLSALILTLVITRILAYIVLSIKVRYGR